MKMYTIWSNEYDVIESIAKDMMEYDEGLEWDRAWDQAYEVNAESLDDEKRNLNIEVGDEIIIIADLGLWDGQHQAYKLLNRTNIADCLTGTCGDYVTWFVDDRGDLMCRDIHHDGTNLYTYRAWKPGVTPVQRVHFLYKVQFGKATRKDVTRYTRKIGTYVADVYGWKVRR